MGKLQLRIFPDPALRKKAVKIERFGTTAETVKEMARIMYASKGIGLAAPQVGLSIRLFIIDVGDGLREFIDPQITIKPGKITKMEEGCLSVPGVGVVVKRPQRIRVRAQNAEGGFFAEEFEGLAARAIQHENDHLNGKLIIDYLDPVRHFIAARRFRTSRDGRKSTTCEVTCYDRKRDTGRA